MAGGDNRTEACDMDKGEAAPVSLFSFRAYYGRKVILLYLFAVTILFFLAFLHEYRVALKLEYREKVLRLYWLPRVCCGYAAARPLRRRRQEHGGGRGPLRNVIRFLRRGVVEELDFLFLPGCPGHLTCIFSLRFGDIIRIAIPLLVERQEKRRDSKWRAKRRSRR